MMGAAVDMRDIDNPLDAQDTPAGTDIGGMSDLACALEVGQFVLDQNTHLHTLLRDARAEAAFLLRVLARLPDPLVQAAIVRSAEDGDADGGDDDDLDLDLDYTPGEDGLVPTRDNDAASASVAELAVARARIADLESTVADLHAQLAVAMRENALLKRVYPRAAAPAAKLSLPPPTLTPVDSPRQRYARQATVADAAATGYSTSHAQHGFRQAPSAATDLSFSEMASDATLPLRSSYPTLNLSSADQKMPHSALNHLNNLPPRPGSSMTTTDRSFHSEWEVESPGLSPHPHTSQPTVDGRQPQHPLQHPKHYQQFNHHENPRQSNRHHHQALSHAVDENGLVTIQNVTTHVERVQQQTSAIARNAAITGTPGGVPAITAGGTVVEKPPHDLSLVSTQISTANVNVIVRLMVGAFLLKYNRRRTRAERRYVNVNPYSRTISWSKSEPGASGDEISTGANSFFPRWSLNVPFLPSATLDTKLSVYMQTVFVEDLTDGRSRIVVQASHREIVFECSGSLEHAIWERGLTLILQNQSRPSF
ncbi:hypothetical protein HDU83_006890 [Entophlyctis luteolus]|nr:hypothetical protein HDU83_006890 [Entophlyctis luteolus]